jgi:hypothetical protein
MQVSGQFHVPAALFLEMHSRYPLHKRLGAPQSPSGRCTDLLPLPKVESRSSSPLPVDTPTELLNYPGYYPE